MSSLMESVRSRGIVLSAEGDKLRYDAPQGAMTPELLDQIRQHKAELLQALTDDRYQEWDFRIVYIGQDPWMMGTRLDQSGQYVAWFIGKPKTQ